ncbi:putative Transmembrane protein [Heracleum sosnowskyi]|uniref:Transmembrane protein n=1 Tax=Heracleum sosnowskyi TaxID=360622 RepID=A0AAD8MRB1_9APIA|nr:putative Transmembrane protein [Heracleum sosnowskyi]
MKNMLGLISLPNPQTPFPISLNQSNPTPKSPFPKFQSLPFTPKLQKKFIFHATQETKNGLKPEADNKNGLKNDGLEDKEDLKKDNEMPKFNFRWVDLVLDPDPQNIVAVALTGLLTWASVQVLWQLFLISLAILVAALKYSFIAAVLLFVLITLL